MTGSRFYRIPASALSPAVLVVLVAACLPLSNQDVHVIESWLTSSPPDSSAGSRVQELGTSFWKGRATRSLLGEALEGPEYAGPENLVHRFTSSYRRILRPATSRDEYVSFHMENFVSMFQARAANALAAIGGEEAVSHLEQAYARDWTGTQVLRNDVRSVVLSSLVSSRWDAFQGSVSPVSIGVLDTVEVHAGSNAFDGDERVLLYGGPFPDDVVVDSGAVLRFVAAAPVGAHQPVVTGVRSPLDTISFSLNVGSISYRGHPPDTAVQVDGHPTPERIYSVLSGLVSVQHGGVVRDSATRRELGMPFDHFKITAPAIPPITRTVTVLAEWRGTSAVDLVWTPCEGSYGGSPRFQGYVLGPDSRPLGSAVLTIFAGAVQFGIMATGTGRFSFVPPAQPDSVRVDKLGYSTRVFHDIRLSNRDHLLRLGTLPAAVAPPTAPILAPIPAPIPAPTPGPAPHQTIRAESDSTRLQPGECQMLKLVKLDDKNGYVIIRLAFAVRPPL